jgi:hypothetical protein
MQQDENIFVRSVVAWRIKKWNWYFSNLRWLFDSWGRIIDGIFSDVNVLVRVLRHDRVVYVCCSPKLLASQPNSFLF